MVLRFNLKCFQIVVVLVSAKAERRNSNMEGKTEYQIRVLPSNPREYITLDSNPQRDCEAYLVYTIDKDIFTGVNVKFRIRQRAKEFVEVRFGKLFAVLCKHGDKQECLYFGRLFVKNHRYPELHKQPVLRLVRCVGTYKSKHHFKKVYDYIFSHYDEVSKLELGEVIEMTM